MQGTIRRGVDPKVWRETAWLIPNWGEPLFTFPGHPCLPSRGYKVLFPQEEFQILQKYRKTKTKMWMIPSLESLQFALCDDDCYTAERTHATSSRAGVDRRITFFECRVLFAFIRMVTILTLMNGLKVARGVDYDHETPTVRC